MKKLWALGLLLGGLAALNAKIDASRECGCPPECWCKQPGLRHVRWLIPISHRAVPPEWKQGMESASPS